MIFPQHGSSRDHLVVVHLVVCLAVAPLIIFQYRIGMLRPLGVDAEVKARVRLHLAHLVAQFVAQRRVLQQLKGRRSTSCAGLRNYSSMQGHAHIAHISCWENVTTLHAYVHV